MTIKTTCNTGVTVIECPGWIMHILKDGGIRLLPPAAWVLELEQLVENKTINQAGAKAIIETWQQETLLRINRNVTST